MTAATHAAPARHLVGLGALWFGLFGAAAAWSIQELVGYAVIAHACYASWRPLPGSSIGGVWTIALVVSLLTLLVAAAAALTAHRSWRRTRQEHRSAERRQLEAGEGRVRFMALSGLIVSSIFLFNIVMNTIVLFLVPACG